SRVQSATELIKQSDQSQNKTNEEENLPKTAWMVSSDVARNAVDEDLVSLGAVIVGDEPDRKEDMLEGLVGELGIDIEIAMSIPGHLLGTKAFGFIFHPLTRLLGGADQIHLVLFDRPAGQVRSRVGDELFCGEIFDLAQKVAFYSARAADQFVIKEMFQVTGRRLPADVLDLAGFGLATF